MFILLHWYCHRGFGCGKMITFTLKIFNLFGDVYTRNGTISLCQRDASAQIVVSHNYPTQVLGSIPFTPSVVTKWHDRHRYLSIHHVPYLMSLSSPRHCSKTLSFMSPFVVTEPQWVNIQSETIGSRITKFKSNRGGNSKSRNLLSYCRISQSAEMLVSLLNFQSN